MTSHDHAPSPEGDRPNPELIQYSDGQVALALRTPGDELDLGSDSDQEYAQHLQGPGHDMAVVQTASGNTYGIAHGFVVNGSRQTVHDLPEGTLRVTVGKPLEIPGVTTTTDVRGVFLRYKSAAGEIEGAEQVPQPGPFKELDTKTLEHLYSR